MRYLKITTFVFIASVFVVYIFVTASSAKEPTRPRVDRVFDSKKEAKIQSLTNLPLNEAFESLKNAEFFTNEDLMNKGIHEGFKGRKRKAIAFAMQYLKFSQSAGTDSTRWRRARDLYAAKKILHVFPDEAVDDLLVLYDNGGPEIRKNVIYVAGTMAGGPIIRNMLIEALDDKSFCEENNPEMIGEPLRICDVAYNQLVLRYKIKDVLRAIGNTHRIEVRNYHIDILKDLL